MRSFALMAMASLFIASGSPLKADGVPGTVGYLRDSCLLAMRLASSGEADADYIKTFQIGYCHGVMNAERRVRAMACYFTDDESDTINLIGRDLLGVTDEQMIQSFLNWSQKYPQFWNDSLSEIHSLLGQFSEWPCNSEKK